MSNASCLNQQERKKQKNSQKSPAGFFGGEKKQSGFIANVDFQQFR
jgi:hypothetical protein